MKEGVVQTLSKNPLVSIIVPSFNQGTFIRETIDSILEQDYRPIEILVIDGASEDNTLDVLQSYDQVPEIYWISEPDSGVVEAVNKGFSRAQGEFAAIQSSDDCYLPGAVSQGVRELQRNPDLALVFGDIVKIDEHGMEISREVLGAYSFERILSCQTRIPQPSCFFRLSLAKALGGWRESVPYAADTDLWLRMLLRADARKCDAFWAKRRMHGQQRDVQGMKIIRDYSRMIADLFSRFGAASKFRPAAEAGILMVQNRYSYGEGKKAKVKRMREAVRLYPPLKGFLYIPSEIPGLDFVRSRLKNGLKRLDLYPGK